MNKISALLILLLCFITNITRAQSATAKKSIKKPNIIFILVDDMGWKDLGTYGSDFYETPNIDELASQGMKFMDAYASSTVCSPSRSSIMTGQYPVHTGITDWIIGRQNSRGPQPTWKVLPPQFNFNLPQADTTIAEALKNYGYATCYSGKWHLGIKESAWPKANGFDENYGGWAAGNPRADGMGGYFSPYNNPKLKDGPRGEFLTDRLTTETIGFIKKQANKGQPFFADLSFYAVHQPIEAKKKYIKKFKQKAHRLGLDTLKTFVKNDNTWKSSGLTNRIVQSNPVYAGLIYSIDENIGRIMNVLKELGISQNTILVFTSDNGGVSTAQGSPTSNLPLKDGKGFTYEGGMRVPLIIKWPGHTPPGSVSNHPVVNTDFYPTFLQMADLPAMPNQVKDGKSLVSVLKGNKPTGAPRPIFWHYPHYSDQGGAPSSVIREGRWKLVQFYGDNHSELYNLDNDIEERNDLSAGLPQKAARMLHALNKWKQNTNAKIPMINPFYNPNYPDAIKTKNESYQKYMKDYRSQFSKDVYDPELAKSINKRLHR